MRLFVLLPAFLLWHSAFGQLVEATPPAEVAKPEELRVTDVFLHRHPGVRQAGLNQSIAVTVNDMSRLLALAKNAAGQEKEIILFIDHVPLTGLVREPTNPKDNTLVYRLTRNPDDKQAWATLLGAPKGFAKKVEVSVGLMGGYPLATEVQDFNLIVIRKFWALFTLLAILVLVVCLFWLAKNTSILRDNKPQIGDLPRPFSLARSQMAVWFVLTMIAMLVIWTITGGLDGPTASVLSLIGIGSGTALGAALVESGKKTNTAVVDQPDVDKNRQEWEAATTPEEKQTLISQFQEAGYVSESYLPDILSDMNGISFHRFQMTVFTLFLGLVFLVDVYQKLAMPDFDSTLLSLMGISSGTYLGFKFPEK